MSARCIMVLGTTSGAGKSWLVTALCRYYARQGLKVAPFKAQNMSNNARVVGPAQQFAGGEIGSAQYFQALAARAMPDVRMNPLLLKPERDTHSQVVVLGQVSEILSTLPWRERSAHVWPLITQALDSLRAENDVVVIEGAGSPAEINLAASDIVNMRVAHYASAACLLVTDIDRGGAFAHLYGTWALLPPVQRPLIRGFVLNKFRGDASLLAPAPQMLQELTGIATVATLPMWWQHGLPEEDGFFDERSAPGLPQAAPQATMLTIAVIAYPRISNLDEFQPLKNIPGVRLLWVRTRAELSGITSHDWIILPGSKHTSGDLAWLRAQGLDAVVSEHAGRGGAVLGVCGGLQMLGEALIDPHGVDGNAPGLGLLPLVTVFAQEKTVKHTQTGFLSVEAIGGHSGGLVMPNAHKSPPGTPSNGPDQVSVHENVKLPVWDALAGLPISGYEIHHGQTQLHTGLLASGHMARAVLPDQLGWCNAQGNVMGLYLHGLFEDAAVLQALFGDRMQGPVPALDTVFEGLADFINTHFEPGVLQNLLSD
jgi:adenosylcobyric acid synthase